MGKQQNPALEEHVSGQSNQPLSQPAHCLKWKQVAEELNADIDDGLTASEASSRLEQFGKNELGDGKGVNPGKILVRQIANAMTLVLIIAMVVSFAIQSWIEGGVIVGVIFINIAVGFYVSILHDTLSSQNSGTVQAGSLRAARCAKAERSLITCIYSKNSKPRRPWIHYAHSVRQLRKPSVTASQRVCQPSTSSQAIWSS